MTTRRHLFALVASSLLLGACATAPQGASQPPIVFVHGNGDSASIWQSTVWRFESTPSTCPTRWRETTTARHNPAAHQPPNTWLTSRPRSTRY